MRICIKTKEGEFKLFDSSEGDTILVEGKNDELEIIESGGTYIYIPEDSPDDTGEDLVHYLLNGTPPEKTLRDLRELMGIYK